jgi:hypothetical protein
VHTHYHPAKGQAMQCCSWPGSVSTKLRPGNYIETRHRRDYNVPKMRRLMVARPSVSGSSSKTQNGGATSRYHCEVQSILLLMPRQKCRSARWPFRKIIFSRGDFEDAGLHTGRPFRTSCETGLDNWREIAQRAITTFGDKTYSIFWNFTVLSSCRRTLLMWPGRTSPLIRSKPGDVHEYVARGILAVDVQNVLGRS